MPACRPPATLALLAAGIVCCALTLGVFGGIAQAQPATARAAQSGWLQPPPILQQPSRSGLEGPPRPYGVEPSVGSPPPSTAPGWKRRQDRALLSGPFPTVGLKRGISDGTLLLSEVARTREQTLQRIRASGASVVRIPVDWRAIVDPEPGEADQSDPSSPIYDFARLDAAVLSAVSEGLTPLLVVSHAPAFAEAPGRWAYAYPGSWAPSPTALGAFAQALARRYDGTFPDPASGAALPRVTLFQAWNEPNLPHYLEPQWVVQGGHWTAFSPLLYRQMLNAFYAGVKSILPADIVLSGGVAPNGDPVGVGRMAPMSFLRGMLCLGHADRSSCPDAPHFDVLAFHPLSVGDPDAPASSSLDVSIADAGKITTLLGQAVAAHTALPAGPKPVWVTELNWESNPPSPRGVPDRLQAPWISRALHRLWIAGVTLVDWQFLIDPYPGARLVDPTGRIIELPRPAGLYSPGPGGDPAGARPKPFLRGFRLPFDPLRVDRHRVRVWALLMRPGEPVILERRGRAGRWRSIAHLHADGRGILNVLLRLRGACEVRLQSGALRSAVAALPLDRSRL